LKDYQTSIEKLRTDAAEAALIRDLAADKTKRELYDRLYHHFSSLADEVELVAKTSSLSKAGGFDPPPVESK
jgi:hypothetical protein